jgi:hypothetical protein
MTIAQSSKAGDAIKAVQRHKESVSKAKKRASASITDMTGPEFSDSGRVDDSRWVVINSTELRFHSIEMEVLEAEGPVVRRSPRTAARSAISQAHLTRKYRLPTATEHAVLKACWKRARAAAALGGWWAPRTVPHAPSMARQAQRAT